MPNLYFCFICENSYQAHEFLEQINQWYGLREFRILCRYCVPAFNLWKNKKKLDYVKDRIEKFYGSDQFIYALLEPVTDEIRYVGRSNAPQKRYNRHLEGFRELTTQICPTSRKTKIDCDCDTHKTRNPSNSSRYWIADLKRRDLKPTLKILEKVEPPHRVIEREMRWIGRLIQQKTELLNAENQCFETRTVISKRKANFLEVPLAELQKNGFLKDFLGTIFRLNKASGWHYAEFIYCVENNVEIEQIQIFSVSSMNEFKS